MRSIRFALGAAVALSVTTIAGMPVAHATAPTAPYNALTMDGSGSDRYFGADYLADPNDGTLTGPTATAPTGSLQFQQPVAAPGDSTRSLSIELASSDGTALTVHDYPVTNSGPVAGDVSLYLSVDGGYCYGNSGTLNVSDVQVDGSGFVSAFAADYSGVGCALGSSTQSVTLSGSIRWNSSQPYSALAPAARSWDWGNQLVKADAQPVTITFTNAGTATLSPGAASITGATSVFTIKSNTCTAALDPGASCAVRVGAHPLHTAGPDTGTLHLSVPGLADRIVNLTVEGSASISEAAFGGPERVRLDWQQLPAPIGAQVQSYQVLRGTHSNVLTPLHTVAGVCCPVSETFTDSGVTAGTTYYYSVQPVFTNGAMGVTSPVVAAEPWPKYSAGMYHRIGPARLLKSQTVTAGHAYRLGLLGAHNIPSAGVAAVALTVTAAKPTQDTSVTVYPRGTQQPVAADVAVPKGATRSNLVIARVGSLGSVLIANAHGSASVTVDVSGYFSGSGLASSSGQGGALQEYVQGGTILDTKGWGWGPLPSQYYADAPVNFDAADTPHVTSLLVQVTAYGSTAGGTITGYATNGRVPGTSVLAYSAGITSTSTAIISAGRWTDPSSFEQYPSVSFLNRGPKPVQLKVSIIGFFDDNTFLVGQRYHPTSPTRLFADTMYAGGTRTIRPGSYGHTWTTAINVKVRASAPSKTTSLSMWPRWPGVSNAAQPQLRALAGKTAIASTPEATGTSNVFYVHNAYGHTGVAIWAFGTFDGWPLPSWQYYVGEYAGQTSAALPSAIEHGLDDPASAPGGSPVVVHDLARVGPGGVAEHPGYRYQLGPERR